MIDISKSYNKQQTIAEPVSISGIGLHSGVDVSINLYPAKADYGQVYTKDIANNNIVDAYMVKCNEYKIKHNYK